MSNLAITFLGIALVCLITSFVGRANEIVDGLGKALFGVFLILFFIVRFFGEENA
jgi:uncharacterized membrane protein YtjA (UPF0391 family)